VESGIFALALWPDQEQSSFNWSFFRDSENCLADISPVDAELEPYLRVIDIAAVSGDRLMHIYMNGEEDRAVGLLGDRVRE
jgi:hypothetical protein